MCRLKHPRLWQYWLGALVGSFGIMEYPSIKHKCHPPLSETLAALRLGIPIAVGGLILGWHVHNYPLPDKDAQR